MVRKLLGLFLLAGTAFAAGLVAARRRPLGRALPVRTRDELEDAVPHIAYEFVALERALQAFQRPPADGGQRRFDLEACLLHVRNLTDFLWTPTRRRRPHRDGVYAAHYLRDPGTWQRIRAGLRQIPSQRYDALSAQLAHVSTARSSTDARDFGSEVAARTTDLTNAWNRWIEALDGSEWPPRFASQIAHWREAP